MKQVTLLLALLIAILAGCDKNSSVSNGQSVVGQGGSLARFTIVGNYLYTVDGEYLSVFDISNTGNPVYKNKMQVGFNIEALFPFNGKLFIASNTAMYIYTISNPSQPVKESQIDHLTGCDPIVANDTVAYLTIHGGNRCGSMLNQLQVYDIHSITHPQFITSINMSNPMGLGMKGQRLYVCDHGTGLRVLDISDPYDPTQEQIITGESFMDVIIVELPTMETILVAMLSDGIAYYNITDPNQITKLATVKN